MKVSIIVLCYNHELYIRETLESLLNQKTNFNFEILIGDDCSKDNSRATINQFFESFPHIIKKIFPNNNLGPNANYMNCFKNASGKYIAFCEGDDYWIDDYKLQKQVDFLEENPEYGGACGEVISKDVENNTELKIPIKKEGIIRFEDIILKNKIHSNTILFRSALVNMESLNDIKTLSIGDWYLHLLVTMQKPYYYLPEYFALYRVHDMGIFSKKSNFFKSYQKARLLNVFLNKEANSENVKLIRKSLDFQISSALRESTVENKKEILELLNIKIRERIFNLNSSILKGIINIIK